MNYSTFNGAYAEENLQKIDRVSYDIPTNLEQWKDIISRTPVIVIYMWSDSCRPCHLIRDKFERMAHQFKNDHVLFFKDNIDLPTSFHRDQVDVVPTFFLICDGRELKHPVYKSVYNGWADQIYESVQYHISQSNRIQQLQQQEEEQEASPSHERRKGTRLFCHNNVCYIKKDDI